jgi:hypothetical protein
MLRSSSTTNCALSRTRFCDNPDPILHRQEVGHRGRLPTTFSPLLEDGSMMALTLALVAGMAVGRDGQERISTETKQHFLGNGYWEGIWRWAGPPIKEIPIRLEPGKFIQGHAQSVSGYRWVDEGQGKCRLIVSDTPGFLGRYKREAGELTICLLNHPDGRPTKFEAIQKPGSYLFILKPAKPPKK